MKLVVMKVKFALVALVAAITLLAQPVVAQEAAPAAADRALLLTRRCLDHWRHCMQGLRAVWAGAKTIQTLECVW